MCSVTYWRCPGVNLQCDDCRIGLWYVETAIHLESWFKGSDITGKASCQLEYQSRRAIKSILNEFHWISSDGRPGILICWGICERGSACFEPRISPLGLLRWLVKTCKRENGRTERQLDGLVVLIPSLSPGPNKWAVCGRENGPLGLSFPLSLCGWDANANELIHCFYERLLCLWASLHKCYFILTVALVLLMSALTGRVSASLSS